MKYLLGVLLLGLLVGCKPSEKTPIWEANYNLLFEAAGEFRKLEARVQALEEAAGLPGNPEQSEKWKSKLRNPNRPTGKPTESIKANLAEIKAELERKDRRIERLSQALDEPAKVIQPTGRDLIATAHPVPDAPLYLEGPNLPSGTEYLGYNYEWDDNYDRQYWLYCDEGFRIERIDDNTIRVEYCIPEGVNQHSGAVIDACTITAKNEDVRTTVTTNCEKYER